MQSQLLIEYMRTGAITPLKKGDTKSQVESKLGAPDDWKGRIAGIGWVGSLFADYHDSWAWHYGSLCVCFADPRISGPPGISLSYSDALKPIGFPPPFAELPQNRFTLRDLIDLLRSHDVRFNDNRGDREFGSVLVSEGGVGVVTLHGDCSPKAQVLYLSRADFNGD